MCRRDIGVCVLPPAEPFEDPAGVGVGGVKPVYRYGRPAARNDPVVRRRSVASLATRRRLCCREREREKRECVCPQRDPLAPVPPGERRRGLPFSQLLGIPPTVLVFVGNGNAIPVPHGVATWRIPLQGPVPLGAHGARRDLYDETSLTRLL